MKAVLQRVLHASVKVDNIEISSIETGMLVLLGVHCNDTNEDMDWLLKKIAQIRIFDDENGVMNRDALQTGADMMVVSQFTLLAATKKGNRPSYIAAMEPNKANQMYELFVEKLEAILGKTVARGAFGKHMQIELSNDGPATIVLDTKNKDS
jgi:D-tyrosyl-tRNA(Tyr) deacylase